MHIFYNFICRGGLISFCLGSLYKLMLNIISAFLYIVLLQLGAGDSDDIGKLLGNKNEESKGLPLKKTDKTLHDEEEPLAKRQAVATSASELPGIFTGPVKVGLLNY